MTRTTSYNNAITDEIFDLVSTAADRLNVEAYVIGGYVRDFILNRSNAKDIDIVAVGSGIALAKEVAQSFPHKPEVKIFKNYGTAMVRFRDIELEFVGARKESYAKESRNPKVENGSLQDDQNRRDSARPA